MSKEPEWAEIDDVVCTYETENAILCEIGGEKVWVPRKLISEESFVAEKGDEGVLIVAEWFALQNDLE